MERTKSVQMSQIEKENIEIMQWRDFNFYLLMKNDLICISKAQIWVSETWYVSCKC